MRVSDEDAVSWRASAKAEGVSLSRWIRDRVGTPVPTSVTPSARVGTPGTVREAVSFASRAGLQKAAVSRGAPVRLDSRCVNAQYHWKGFCKVCG